MWEDDKSWYPIMFENKFFEGYFFYENSDKMIEHKINIFDKYEDLLDF